MININYRENIEKTKQYKLEYLEGFEKIISNRQKELEKKRNENLKKIFNDNEHYREELKKMLGWPLVDHPQSEKCNIKIEPFINENGIEISRCSFEILDGLKLFGLLFKKNDSVKRSMVIVQHGANGTPELISNFYCDTYNYNNIIERVLKYDVNVFAAQLLLWDTNIYELNYDRNNIDARLKSIGGSITSVEIFGLIKVIDYFDSCDYVGNIGMIGLSYGGFYTLYTAAVDKRIKVSLSSCFFNERNKYLWTDWTWQNSCKKFSDVEIAMLVYPRSLYLEVGDKDECFDVVSAKKEFERLRSVCENNVDWCPSFNVFEGEHEFCKDDIILTKFMEELL